MWKYVQTTIGFKRLDEPIYRNNQKTRNIFIFATSQFQGIMMMMMIRPLGEKRWMNYDHTRHLTMSCKWWMILTQLNFLQKLFYAKKSQGLMYIQSSLRIESFRRFHQNHTYTITSLKASIGLIDEPQKYARLLLKSLFFKIEWSINQV